MADANRKDFFPDITDPDERAALITAFFAQSGKPDGRPVEGLGPIFSGGTTTPEQVAKIRGSEFSKTDPMYRGGLMLDASTTNE